MTWNKCRTIFAKSDPKVVVKSLTLLSPLIPLFPEGGIEWSLIKIFKCSQNFAFARFARKI